MTRRTNNFDALRLLGAMMVLVNHSMALSGAPTYGFASESISTLGVDMFFAISGYMITGSWIRDPSVVRFVWRRVRRIVPALAFVVLLSTFVLGPLVTTLSLHDYLVHPATLRYLGNIVFHASFALPGVFVDIPLPNAVNGSLWTLPVEVTMYAATPFLAFASRRSASLIILLLVIAGGFGMHFFLGHPTPFVVYGTELWTNSSLFPFFVAGAAIAALRLESRLNWRVGIGALLLLDFAGPILGVWQHALMFLVLPYVVIAVGQSRWPVFSNAGRWGDFSYGIYLWAFPIQQFIVYLAGPNYAGWRNVMLATPLVVGMAVISWYLIERPMLLLGSMRRKDVLITEKPQRAVSG